MRDLKAVGMKFKHVLYLKEKNTLLKECKFQIMVQIVFNFIFYSINYIFRGLVGPFDALHIHGYVS